MGLPSRCQSFTVPSALAVAIGKAVGAGADLSHPVLVPLQAIALLDFRKCLLQQIHRPLPEILGSLCLLQPAAGFDAGD